LFCKILGKLEEFRRTCFVHTIPKIVLTVRHHLWE